MQNYFNLSHILRTCTVFKEMCDYANKYDTEFHHHEMTVNILYQYEFLREYKSSIRDS